MLRSHATPTNPSACTRGKISPHPKTPNTLTTISSHFICIRSIVSCWTFLIRLNLLCHAVFLGWAPGFAPYASLHTHPFAGTRNEVGPSGRRHPERVFAIWHNLVCRRPPKTQNSYLQFKSRKWNNYKVYRLQSNSSVRLKIIPCVVPLRKMYWQTFLIERQV